MDSLAQMRFWLLRRSVCTSFDTTQCKYVINMHKLGDPWLCFIGKANAPSLRWNLHNIIHQVGDTNSILSINLRLVHNSKIREESFCVCFNPFTAAMCLQTLFSTSNTQVLCLVQFSSWQQATSVVCRALTYIHE